jgi:AcrR family transcriptional regulator
MIDNQDPRAGMSRTSYYRHFASPEDLAIHALNGDVRSGQRRLDQTLARASRSSGRSTSSS